MFDFNRKKSKNKNSMMLKIGAKRKGASHLDSGRKVS